MDAGIIRPSVIAVVNHLARHSAVYADVLSCYESCFLRAKEQNHVGNIRWLAYPADRLLHRMGKTGGAIGFACYLDKLERLEVSADA